MFETSREAVDQNLLENLYLNEFLSIRDIAKKLGITVGLIRGAMKKYVIPQRNKYWKASSNKNGRDVPCSTCGKLVYRKKYLLEKFKVFFCSWKCEKEYQSLTRKTSVNKEAWRSRREYKLWRKYILLRDNGVCRMCGSSNKLVAHHIIEAEFVPDLKFDISNGITLCKKCHIEIHKDKSPNYIGFFQEIISGCI
jgi:5-methylcytosine-specific restriction endonuclease McrA